MYGLTRATVTLIGVAAAGLLLYVASQFGVETTGDYWAWIGFMAAAGLVIALSQLLGGWTKWGWPRMSLPVLLLGFVPALLVGGIVLLYAQPDGGVFGQGLADDLGVEGFAEDLVSVLPAIAFGLGLVFGLTFDTTGPRVREVDVDDDRVVRRRDDDRVAEEPLTAERTTTTRYPSRDETPSVAAAGAVPDRDRDGDGDRDVPAVTRTETTTRRTTTD
jgi:hypothetical protein